MNKIPVGVLGATGTVGQRFVQLLADHPWFEVVAVTGSDRTVGRPYGEGVNWLMPGRVPARTAELIVQPTAPNLDIPGSPPVVFSALPTGEAMRPRSGSRSSPPPVMPWSPTRPSSA